MAIIKPYYHKDIIEAGLDEAGRGCYAGPVYAAAVILPKDFYHPLLNDSKQVNEKNRYILRQYIEEHAIAWSVAYCSVEEIEILNILKASFTAMHKAIDGLKKKPGFLLVDGNRFIKYKRTAHQCFVGGDAEYASIAAASILAKTWRDDHMKELHAAFPQYGWDHNKGYGTAEHRKAIEKHGLCLHHRRSFNIQPRQQGLF